MSTHALANPRHSRLASTLIRRALAIHQRLGEASKGLASSTVPSHDARPHERSAPATRSPVQLPRHSFSRKPLFLARFPMHVRRQGKCSIRQNRVDTHIGVAAECRRAVDQLTCRGGQRLQYGHRSQMSGANKIGSHLAPVRIRKLFLRGNVSSRYLDLLDSRIGGVHAEALPSGHGRFVAESWCC